MTIIMEELKKERERFVAFAFAAAEIFLEIDPQGVIQFEGGAIERISASGKDSLIGKKITDIIEYDDHDVFKALLLHLEYKGRIGPIPIRFIMENKRRIALRVFALGMPGTASRIFLALRAAPLGIGNETTADAQTGLIAHDDFMKLATVTMTDSLANNHLYLTALEIKGLPEKQTNAGQDPVQHILKKIAAHLQALSIDGQAAGQISDRHFAFLHRTKMDGEQLSKTIETFDETGALKPTYFTMSTEGADQSEDKILRTVSYILNKFCSSAETVTFSTLSDAYEAMACDAKQRITEMTHMIEGGNFKIVFQPVVSLKDGEILHNEVLSRFEKDSDPLETLQFAEEIGLIETFDIALCKKAIDYIRKMKKLGSHTHLSINISSKTLESERYSQLLADLLMGAKDIAHSLILEITNTAMLKNIERAAATLSDLKSIGYKLCLDDFGSCATGYRYLNIFNIDFVKIESIYMREMNSADYHPTFLMSTVRLCEELNIKIIGEHVETQYQVDYLKSLGVDYAQGYYFGKPDYSPRNNKFR